MPEMSRQRTTQVVGFPTIVYCGGVRAITSRSLESSNGLLTNDPACSASSWLRARKSSIQGTLIPSTFVTLPVGILDDNIKRTTHKTHKTDKARDTGRQVVMPRVLPEARRNFPERDSLRRQSCLNRYFNSILVYQRLCQQTSTQAPRRCVPRSPPLPPTKSAEVIPLENSDKKFPSQR